MYTFEEIRALIVGCYTVYVEFQISDGHYMQVEVKKEDIIRQLNITNQNWKENKDDKDDNDCIFEAKVRETLLMVGVYQ